MCHPLNLGINGETRADPSASYSVMARGQEHKCKPRGDLSVRLCWCFVGCARFGNLSATIHEIHIDPLSLHTDGPQNILHLITYLFSSQFNSATSGK